MTEHPVCNEAGGRNEGDGIHGGHIQEVPWSLAFLTCLFYPNDLLGDEDEVLINNDNDRKIQQDELQICLESRVAKPW